MNEPQTISFVATAELKRQLDQWAAQEDRSISATLRQILAQEAQRRQQAARQQQAHTIK